MLKNIFLLLAIISTGLQAQYSITGKMDPLQNYSWVALYQLQGAKQNYISNSGISNGEFKMEIPGTSETGIYRILYDLENRLFVDIIFNKENISFTFHPRYPNKIIKFNESDENILYQNYLNAITTPQHQLDSMQVAYFNTVDSDKRAEISNLYNKHYTTYINTQKHFELSSSGKLANHFIKASARYNLPEPILSPMDYLKEMKAHFFDFIDFNNPVLLNSTFINDKINDYIFYLNTSEDKPTLNQLQKEAITTVLNKIQTNSSLTKDIEEGLLYNYTRQQNIELVNFLLNHYIKLPKEFQDIPFVNDIKAQLKTAVGMKAPNITWHHNNIDKELYNLVNANNYIIVFWSSTCSHCLKEMPVLYDFLKNDHRFKVIAIGLEDDESKQGYEDEIKKYPNFLHIYGANKWENEHARNYAVNATPSFFVLNTNKEIIAKPDNVEELKVFLQNTLKD